MPYERKGKCVYKKDGGAKVGCSSSKEGAKKYLKKLYSVADDEEMPVTVETFEEYFQRKNGS